MRRRLPPAVCALVVAACTHQGLDLANGTTPTQTPTATPTSTATPVPCKGSGTICGFGFDGNGDGGPALSARFQFLNGLFADRAGNVWIADGTAARIRRIAPDGTIETVVGSGTHSKPAATGVAALSASLDTAAGVAVDGAGRLYWGDHGDEVVYSLDSTGKVVAVAGGGNSTAEGVAPTQALLATSPYAEISAGYLPGVLLISNMGSSVVRVANLGSNDVVVAGTAVFPGTIETIAGSVNNYGNTGNGGLALAAQLGAPGHALLMAGGSVVITDGNFCTIRVVGSDGIIEPIADSTGVCGETGDGGPALSGEFGGPSGTAFDGTHGLFVLDGGDNVAKAIDLSATASLSFPGISIPPSDLNRVFGSYSYASFRPAFEPVQTNPLLVGIGTGSTPPAILPDGDLIVLDVDRGLLWKLSKATGLASVFAGMGTDVPSQAIAGVSSVLVDGSNLLLSSSFSLRLIRLHPDGERELVAGNGQTNLGDGSGLLDNVNVGFYANSLARDGAGGLLVSDSLDHVLRLANPAAGTITTLGGTAGTSTGTSIGSGNGGPLSAVVFSQHGPGKAAVDSAGNIFFIDGEQVRAWNASPSATLTVGSVTIAPGEVEVIANSSGAVGSAGEGGSALAATFNFDFFETPSGIAVTAADIFVADTKNNLIRRIDRGSGLVTAFVGTGLYGNGGDGGPAIDATVGLPHALLVNGGDLYWTEDGCVRHTDLAGAAVLRVAGDGFIGDAGDGASAAVGEIQAAGIDVGPDGSVYIAGGGRVRRVLP